MILSGVDNRLTRYAGITENDIVNSFVSCRMFFSTKRVFLLKDRFGVVCLDIDGVKYKK